MTYLIRSISKMPAWLIGVALGALLFVAIGAATLFRSANNTNSAASINKPSESKAGAAAPFKIENIPDDLRNPDLQYAGIFEDGWLSDAPFLGLTQPAEANALVIRGMVSSSENLAFFTQLQATIDNHLIGGKNLGVGNFELVLPIPKGTGLRRIQLAFSDTQPLAADDGRSVAALLQYIGFETKPGFAEKLPSDVTESGVSLGRGWYLPEESNGAIYRWVNNQAEFTISPPEEDEPQALYLELEPGPGLDLKPFELKFLDFSNHTLAKHTVNGRQTLKVVLPVEPGVTTAYKLNVEGGGKTIANERRILNFRVFRAKLGAPAPDIATLKGGLTFGSGWYEPETIRGKTFRWVNNDAELSVTMPATQPDPLVLELETGPGLSNKPFELQLLSSEGKLIAKAPISSREQIKLKLPTAAANTETFKLHVEGGGQTTTGESRILNFRVFSASLGMPRRPDVV
ncbi:MAG: hypothetical protein HOP19_09565, partial [Acidobacteria bacterium]|nr:hypothetical protein [Acidobacteriota bacterium]